MAVNTALFNHIPYGIANDSSGNIYIFDENGISKNNTLLISPATLISLFPNIVRNGKIYSTAGADISNPNNLAVCNDVIYTFGDAYSSDPIYAFDLNGNLLSTTPAYTHPKDTPSFFISGCSLVVADKDKAVYSIKPLFQLLQTNTGIASSSTQQYSDCKYSFILFFIILMLIISR